MEEKNLNLDEVNKIDLDFNGYDDDDNSFGGISETKIRPIAARPLSDTIKNEDQVDEIVDDRNRVPVKTGIIINLNDDENDFNANMKKHSSIEPEKYIADAKVMNVDLQGTSAKGYNEIDMECKYADDTEEEVKAPSSKMIKRRSMFDDDFDNKELAVEDVTTLLPTKKVSVETLEDDYLKELSKKFDETDEKDLDENIESIEEQKQPSLKNILKDLQKKHAQSNKKGAMGMSFHFAGNPQKEREMFNAGIGKQNDIFPEVDIEVADGSLIGSENGSIGGSIEGVAANSGAADVSGEGTGGADSGAGSGGESLKTTNYSKILKEVFDTIGVDVIKKDDGTLLAKDLFNDNNKVNARNIPELIYALQPFIETCIIIPLSLTTKQNFDSYEDWCSWYTDENKQKFPNSSNEIKYCDLLANHITECEL